VGQRHLLRHIGDVLAVDLTSRELNRFIERRRSEEVTATTINHSLETLRAALRHAVEQKAIEALPCRIRLLRTTRKRELPILDPTDVEQLLAHAHEPYRGAILISAHTAFRLSEILHLTWVDVDWSAGRLIVTGKDGWKTKSYEGKTRGVRGE
jgi:integrase